MGFNFFVVDSLYRYSSIKSILSIFVTIPLKIMENTVSTRFETLIKRLNEAERRAKLLNLEVKSIRQEISTLKQTLGTTNIVGRNLIQSGSNVGRQTILLDSLPSTSTVDGPISNKRDREDDDSTQNKRSKMDFKIDEGYIEVYTDGACEHNGKSNAKAGIGVWFGDGNPLNISKPVEGRATNNHAEIRACIEALNVIKEHGGRKVKICTDSEFTINCMTKWINSWKWKGWKTAKGEPVKNKEELQILDKVMSTFEHIKWVHVAGHRGIKGNEEADKLARLGAERYKPNGKENL